jgi:ferredoxin-type protein NapH
MTELVYESHSLTTPDRQQLSLVERLALAVLTVGLLAIFSGLFLAKDSTPFGTRAVWLTGAWLAVIGGGVLYGLRKHLREIPGVRNHGLVRKSLTARGAVGWMFAIAITAFYVCVYWFPQALTGLARLHDPLSFAVAGRAADQWFVYGTFYSFAVLVMGIKAIAKYRHSRYQIIRTCSIIVVQLSLGWLLALFLAKWQQPEVYLSYFWPLGWDKLFPESLAKLTSWSTFGMFAAAWFIVGTLVLTPVLTYYFGKRWYCSWVCGCGGLANTAGDEWRQLSDKSLRAWKLERWIIYSVLVLITVLTALMWFAPYFPASMKGVLEGIKGFYGFAIMSAFSGVIGVGFYPLLGTRVWCRFGCPMAAILGLIQRFFSRFRITTNGAQCISCGNCSKYCEMGIDVRWYAQRGQDIVRSSCVGCGVCSTVCPRGVLSLENGPTETRSATPISLLAASKARPRD